MPISVVPHLQVSTPGNGYGKLVFSIETEEGPMDPRGLDNYRG